MWKAAFLAIVSALLCPGTCVDTGTKYGHLGVILLDPTGSRIESGSLVLGNVGAVEGSAQTLGRSFDKLPYGAYWVRAQVPGFEYGTREIRIDTAESLIRMRLRAGAECAGYASLAGRIEGRDRHGQIWVKAVALEGAESLEAKVENSGQFSFSGLDGGKYVLLFIEDSQIVHTELAEVYDHKFLRVRLAH